MACSLDIPVSIADLGGAGGGAGAGAGGGATTTGFGVGATGVGAGSLFITPMSSKPSSPPIFETLNLLTLSFAPPAGFFFKSIELEALEAGFRNMGVFNPPLFGGVTTNLPFADEF